jgi:murein DD-endopeptidase MepM/ murein hydrolase activator NlpD
MGIHVQFAERLHAPVRAGASRAMRSPPLLIAGGVSLVAMAMIAAPLFAGRAEANPAVEESAPAQAYMGRLLDDDGSSATPVEAIEPQPIQRFRGRLNEGLVAALGESGVPADVARGFMGTIADKASGLDIGPDDHFDLVVDLGAAGGPALVYAALDRVGASDVQLIRVDGKWVDAGGGDGRTVRPVGGRLTSRFGMRHHPLLGYSRLHKGVDFAAAYGSPVRAAASGSVTAAGWAGGYGRQVRIAHGGGLASSYSHLSGLAVAPGGRVSAGQIIGYAGSSGLSTGPHVHYEVRRNGMPVDPLGSGLASASPLDPQMQSKLRERLSALMRLAPQPRG